MSLTTLVFSAFIDDNVHCASSSTTHYDTEKCNVLDFSNEAKMYQSHKHCFEQIDYVVNKNIKLYAKNTVGENYWALRAIDQTLINNGDKIARKWATSLKNLKSIITIIETYDLETIEQVLDNNLKSVDNILVGMIIKTGNLNPNYYSYISDTASEKQILSLLTGGLIAETIDVIRLSNKNIDELTIDRNDINALNKLYIEAFNRFFKRLAKIFTNSKNISSNVKHQILTSIIRKNFANTIVFYDNEFIKVDLWTVLVNCFKHDWDCYLTQFGVICDIPYRRSILECCDRVTETLDAVVTNASKYLPNPSIGENWNICDIERKFEILSTIEKLPQFKRDWDKASKQWHKLGINTASIFIEKNKYNSVYLRYIENWLHLQTVIKEKHLPNNFFELILGELPKFMPIDENYWKLVHYDYYWSSCVDEARVLIDYIDYVTCAIEFTNGEIGQAWFSSYFDYLNRLCDVIKNGSFIRTLFEDNGTEEMVYKISCSYPILINHKVDLTNFISIFSKIGQNYKNLVDENLNVSVEWDDIFYITLLFNKLNTEFKLDANTEKLLARTFCIIRNKVGASEYLGRTDIVTKLIEIYKNYKTSRCKNIKELKRRLLEYSNSYE